jgi:hypothetical protein
MTDSLRRCPGCKHYLRVKAAELEDMEPAFRAESPVFGVPLSGADRMPPVCCFCANVAISDVQVQSPTYRSSLWKTVQLTIRVPHCSTCTTGKKLQQQTTTVIEDNGPFGPVYVKEEPEGIMLYVPSYEFYWAFLALNGWWDFKEDKRLNVTPPKE